MVVEVRGEIDLANAHRLQEVLADASQQRPTPLAVDLLYVTFIDSTGIGALVAACHAARALGVPFTIRQLSPFLAEQLRRVGLYDMLTADD